LEIDFPYNARKHSSWIKLVTAIHLAVVFLRLDPIQFCFYMESIV
jgi:hypothetical protein